MLTADSESARWRLLSEVQHSESFPGSSYRKAHPEGSKGPARFWLFFSLHVEATEATNAVSKSANEEQQNEV